MSHQSQNDFPVDNAKEAADYILAATDDFTNDHPASDTAAFIAIAHALLAIREELRDLNAQIREVNA